MNCSYRLARRHLADLFVAIVVSASIARGQCGTWDNRPGLPAGADDNRSALTRGHVGDAEPPGPGIVFAVTTWELPGSSAPQIVAGGSFSLHGDETSTNIARWDGTGWHALGEGLNGTVYALTTWDPDGTGPLGRVLVAGGRFNAAGGAAASNIATWDGVAWHSLGDGLRDAPSDAVYALCTWDRDGDGPLAPQLIAGGSFSAAGGVALNNIARWDGVWRPIGGGTTGGSQPAVRALAEWDADGTDPAAPQLVAGGTFQSAGGGSASNIARWDGGAWRSLGPGLGGPQAPAVRTIVAWDPDESGPLPPQLVAGGNFTRSGNQPVSSVARWNGNNWQSLGAGLGGGVNALAVMSSTVSLPSQLVAGGTFAFGGSARIARWDGVAWRPMGAGLAGPAGHALGNWNRNPSNPVSYYLVVAGDFDQAGGLPARGIALWSIHPPGDLNNDMIVDALDLQRLLNAWYRTDGGDIDKDGDTDESDLGILLQNWLRTCP
ncbi:MAG: hypothetical protein U1D55_11855 [Phycisphaerae bacterium]